jgi:uncharacterized membrane protein YciS (DUF1049 family)
MDILLKQKYSYKIPASFELTKMKLEKMLNNKWYDLSKKYYGSIDNEGTFTFKQKIIFPAILTFGQTVYLTGNVLKNESGSIIQITLSPNVFFVILIYLLPLLWLNICFGDNSLLGQDNSRLNNFFVVLFVESFLCSVILVRSFFLKKKFEKAIGVKD